MSERKLHDGELVKVLSNITYGGTYNLKYDKWIGHVGFVVLFDENIDLYHVRFPLEQELYDPDGLFYTRELEKVAQLK